MSKAVDERLSRWLDCAEARGRCLPAARGRDRKALKRRVDAEELFEPVPGLFVRRDYWRGLNGIARARHIAKGLAPLHPTWTYCMGTAGLVHGLEVSQEQVKRVHILGRSRKRTSTAMWLVRHELPTDDTEMVGIFMVTSFWRTVFDCMRDADFCRALAIADSALRIKGIDRQEMMRILKKKFDGQPGLRRVLAICAFADGRSENGGESVARGVMLQEGYALPSLQVEVVDPVTGQVYRLDYLWAGEDGLPIAGELDGDCKYEDAEMMDGAADAEEVRRRERRRESRISYLRPKMVRFTYGDVRDRRGLIELLDAFGVPRGEKPEFDRDVPIRSDVEDDLTVVCEELYLEGGWLVYAEELRRAA